MTPFYKDLFDTINTSATKIFTQLVKEHAEYVALKDKTPVAAPQEEEAFDAIGFTSPYGKNPTPFTRTLVINDKITAWARDHNLLPVDSYGVEKLAIIHKINYLNSYDKTLNGYVFKNEQALSQDIDTLLKFDTLSHKINYLLNREHNFNLLPQFQNLEWTFVPDLPVTEIVYNPTRFAELTRQHKESGTGLLHRNTVVLTPTNLDKPQELFYKLRLIDGFHRFLSIKERKIPQVQAFIGARPKPPKL